MLEGWLGEIGKGGAAEGKGRGIARMHARLQAGRQAHAPRTAHLHGGRAIHAAGLGNVGVLLNVDLNVVDLRQRGRKGGAAVGGSRYCW